jgi:peptide-methionine (S)-S-oxide reductase|tara:strand:+ start:523 stop:1014 length:492 start_codon:yes stop_codon:yes gene_type:complete
MCGDVPYMQKAIFGAGCFWGVELTFSKMEGVVSTAVGYCGGKMPDPTYEIVCTGQSGHAEVVLVEFDPEKVSFDKLLDKFWLLHDPTTLNRQGPDIGTQYRSVIFFQDEDQATLSKASKDKLQESGRYKNDVVTEIVSAQKFYRAEEYHQKYLEVRGLGNCHT